MKIITYSIFLFLIGSYAIGQSINPKIEEINSVIKITDSICKIKSEGIAEGTIKYNHIGGNYGWTAYFTNSSENKNQPLRIRYSETQPKANEEINLYYKNGNLIYAELITAKNRILTKVKKIIKKEFYFENQIVIYFDLTDRDIDYLIQKELTIRKMIYK